MCIRDRVSHDMLGLNCGGYVPSFVRAYADLKSVIQKATKDYCDEVKKGEFPEE